MLTNTPRTIERQKGLLHGENRAMMHVKREAMLTHGVTNLSHPQTANGPIQAFVQPNQILQHLVKIVLTNVKNAV